MHNLTSRAARLITWALTALVLIGSGPAYAQADNVARGMAASALAKYAGATPYTAPTYATLNPSDHGSGTLSNGNLSWSGSAVFSVARSTIPVPANSLKYFEVTVTTTTGAADAVNVGVMSNTGGNLLLNNAAGNAAALQSADGYWTGGDLGTLYQADATAIPAGTVIGVAVDTTHNKVWIRHGTDLWNHKSGDDPATNTGGMSLAGWANVYPMVATPTSGTTLTINLGGSPFAYSPPSGFTGGLQSGTTTGTGYSRPINVWDYLTTAEKADVAARTGALDVTSHVAQAIAAMPSTGAGLYFPCGYYNTTGGFTITAPFSAYGCGGVAQYQPLAGTTIACSNGAGSCFTVNALTGSFDQMEIRDTAASRTAGSAILVTSTNENQRINYGQNLVITGFYDSIDIAVGNSWLSDGVMLTGCVHWCYRVRNIRNPDAGDWTITNGNISPASGAAAGIRWESSGNGRIVNNAILPISGTIVSCITMDTTGNPSGQMWIVNNKCENITGIPLNIVAGYSPAFIYGNLWKTTSATAEAMALGVFQQGVIGPNIIQGNGGTNAITTNTMTNSTFHCDIWSGYTNHIAMPMDSSNKDLCTPGVTVAQLPTCNAGAAGLPYWVTDANATTFLSTVAGGGSNKVPVHCNGTAWVIGKLELPKRLAPANDNGPALDLKLAG